MRASDSNRLVRRPLSRYKSLASHSVPRGTCASARPVLVSRNTLRRHSPFCFHHGTLRVGVAGGSIGFKGAADWGTGGGAAGGSDEAGFCFRYLIQYNPVPGMLSEIYRCPLGETPYRKPGIPQLHPMPRLDNVHRNGPRPNTLRNLHIVLPLTLPVNRQILASRILKAESLQTL